MSDLTRITSCMEQDERISCADVAKNESNNHRFLRFDYAKTVLMVLVLI